MNVFPSFFLYGLDAWLLKPAVYWLRVNGTITEFDMGCYGYALTRCVSAHYGFRQVNGAVRSIRKLCQFSTTRLAICSY